MRKRCNISFDMEHPRHAEASRILNHQPVGRRTEFIVDCILQHDQTAKLEKAVCAAVREELRNFSHYQAPDRLENAHAVLRPDEAKLSDVPDSLLHALDDL